MNISDINRLRREMGQTAFNQFYPQYAAVGLPVIPKVPVTILKGDIEVPLTVTLINVAEGKQTASAKVIKEITGWTVKACTDFIKAGDLPKAINTVVLNKKDLQELIDLAALDTCSIKIN